MKKMKKVLLAVLAGVMVLSMFTACNNSGSGSGTNSGSDSTNGEKNKFVLGLDDSFPPMRCV